MEVRYWDNVGGGSVSDLTTQASYPDNPDEVTTLNELRGPTNRADAYGSLVRGFIIPPADGEYRFYVTGDNETQFWLSGNENPDNAEMIALMPGAAAPNDYSRYNSQASNAIELTSQSRYYFEIRHKDRRGEDHFNVAWEGPGISRQVISGDAIASLGQSPYDSGEEITDEVLIEAYNRGYRVGFFDGTQGLPLNSEYPPADMDQDGLYDNWETLYGLDPNDPNDSTSDRDEDLLTAVDEFWLGSSPINRDSDGDGIPDTNEFASELNPADPNDAIQDLDGDGASNLEEYEADTDLMDPGDVPGFPDSETESDSSESTGSGTGEVTITWTAPLTREDGSSIALSEIKTFEVVYGQSPDQMNQTQSAEGSATSATISGLEAGTWYFAVRTIDNDNRSSPLSGTVDFTIE